MFISFLGLLGVLYSIAVNCGIIYGRNPPPNLDITIYVSGYILV
jgi:hypothetical protein